MQNIFKNKFMQTGILMTTLVFSIAVFGNSAQAATGIDVKTHTQEEIRSYIKNYGGDINKAPVYADTPVTSAPYAAGALSDETQQNALAVLNGVRYIAGIPYNVTLDATYISKVQAGTLINYLNKKLTHNPDRPSGMSDDLYQLGCSGTGSSNIEGGSGTSGRPLGKSIVSGWMGDGDASNIDRVGHRRWCLNPSMGKTGFGSVWGPNGCYSAMYSFDKSNTSSGVSVVAWPAQNMPTEYFAANSPWSISRSTAFDSGATVKLTRTSDQKVWNFASPGTTGADGYYNISNAGYGQTGCLIFRPSDITGYYEGDSYQVQVTENGQVVIEYTVDFFDIDTTSDDVTVNLSASSGKIDVAADSYYWSGPKITLSDSSISFSKLSVVSSDEDVVKAMIRSEDTGSGYLFLRGIKDGVATITVSLSKNAYATYQVTVGNGGGHTHVYSQEYTIYEAPTCGKAGKKARFCTGCGEKTDDTTVPATGLHTGGTATCKEKAKCTVCGMLYGDFEEHISSEWIIDIAATVEAEGSMHKECVVCQEELEKESIPKLQEGEGHTHVYSQEYMIYEAPTCGKAGKKARFCTGCGEKTDDTTVPATGLHTGGTATCKEKAKCTVCGMLYGDLEEHTSSEWIIDIAATAEAEGSMHKECVVCQKELEKESIPKLQEGGDQEGEKPDDMDQNGNVSSNPPAGDNTASDKDHQDSGSSKEDTDNKDEDKGSVLGKIQAIAGSLYKVTTDNKSGGTVTYMGLEKSKKARKIKSVRIPDTIKIGNRTYKVTAIAANAFKNNRVLRKITIPASVKSIGKKAFYGCRSLKTITVKTTKLTSKNVGKAAFKGIAKKAVIKVPKSKLKSYRKFLKKKGVPSKAVIRK
ncbi:MAG: leucine-rich repeat protein [Lachnospiraceae bacterium]|nr:leucine-rich repeat protein [Lachnospiraceae bacterium]